MDKTLIFLHIHKTAGTSLAQLLVRQFPRDAVHRMDQHYFRVQQALDALQSLNLESRRRIGCLIGHVAYGVHSLLPQEPAYVTMLREPVSRTLSEYYYVRSAPAPYIHKLLDHKDNLTPFERRFREHLRPESTPANSLEAFLEMGLDAETLNLQTRMLGGFVPPGRFAPPYPPLPEHALQTAKKNLRDNISACGLVERFDESVLLMQSIFSWRNAYYTVENTRRGQLHRKPVAKTTLGKIELHCERDLELYEYAQALFAERLRGLPDLTTAALRRFRRRNRVYQGLRTAYDRTGLRHVRDLFGQTFRR